MARIKAVKRATPMTVVVVGRLSARDLRRLEHICSPALVAAHADLILDMRRVTQVDAVAAAMLNRIAARGAVIHR
jgi:anti-anti-sigma regulatory factor